MSLHAVKILEINFTNNQQKDILKEIQKYLFQAAHNVQFVTQKGVKPWVIVTPNPEQIVFAHKNSHFRDILNRADISLPDGVGVVWASRFFNPQPRTQNTQLIPGVIPGITFMENLVSMAALQRVPIALIGGSQGLALKALECLQKKHQGLLGWATDGPEVEVGNNELRIRNYELGINYSTAPNPKSYIINPKSTAGNEDVYFGQLASRIKESGVKLVFVGLGAPKQEFFIEKLVHSSESIVQRNTKQKSMNPTIFMSVGGSFDEIAGRILRAPGWVSRLGFKWLWRLIHEPWRIGRQSALVHFVWLVLKKRYTLK